MITYAIAALVVGTIALHSTKEPEPDGSEPPLRPEFRSAAALVLLGGFALIIGYGAEYAVEGVQERQRIAEELLRPNGDYGAVDPEL